MAGGGRRNVWHSVRSRSGKIRYGRLRSSLHVSLSLSCKKKIGLCGEQREAQFVFILGAFWSFDRL